MTTLPIGRRSRRFQTLTAKQCWALLTTQRVGRLAWQSTASPQILPINFVLQDGTVYLRTSTRSTIAELTRPTEVALEVDDLDLEQRAGWSVVLHGRSQAAAEPAGLRPLAELDGLVPWAAGLRTMVLKVIPHDISGRVVRRFSDF